MEAVIRYIRHEPVGVVAVAQFILAIPIAFGIDLDLWSRLATLAFATLLLLALLGVRQLVVPKAKLENGGADANGAV